MEAGDPEEVRVAMIVVATMAIWLRNLISVKLFLLKILKIFRKENQTQ